MSFAKEICLRGWCLRSFFVFLKAIDYIDSFKLSLGMVGDRISISDLGRWFPARERQRECDWLILSCFSVYSFDPIDQDYACELGLLYYSGSFPIFSVDLRNQLLYVLPWGFILSKIIININIIWDIELSICCGYSILFSFKQLFRFFFSTLHKQRTLLAFIKGTPLFFSIHLSLKNRWSCCKSSINFNEYIL